MMPEIVEKRMQIMNAARHLCRMNHPYLQFILIGTRCQFPDLALTYEVRAKRSGMFISSSF